MFTLEQLFIFWRYSCFLNTKILAVAVSRKLLRKLWVCKMSITKYPWVSGFERLKSSLSSCGLRCQVSESGFFLFLLWHLKCILSCLNPRCLWKRLVTGGWTLTTLHVFFPRGENAAGVVSVHADSPHSAERIKWSSSQIGKQLGRSSERVLTVTELLHGFLGSLYSQSYDFILAAIEWAQRDFRFWFRVSMTQLQYIIPTQPCFFFPHLFSYDSQKTNSITHLALGFYTHKEKNQYFEYDACWTRCLNQIYENTNLHLLSVWRGFPDRNEALGFPKLKLEVQ